MIFERRAEVARQNVEGRSRNARSLAVPSPDLVMGNNLVQSLAIRSGHNPSSVNDSIGCGKVASKHFGEVQSAGDPGW